MPVTIESIEQALKQYYLGVIVRQINSEASPLYGRISKTTDHVQGKKIVIAMSYGMSGGISFGDEVGVLPEATEGLYKQISIETKNSFGGLQISDKTIKAANGANAGSFVDALTEEVNGVTTASKFNISRAMFMDGTGIVAKCKVNAATTTILVDTVKYLREGLMIDIYNATDNSFRTKHARIVGIDHAAKTLLLKTVNNTPVTTAEGDFITIQDSYNKEITGLGAIYKPTGTIYGADKAVYPWLKPVGLKLPDATQINDLAIEQTLNRIKELSGDEPDYMTTTDGVIRSYMDWMNQMKRNVNTMELNGGYSTIAYKNKPIVPDNMVPDGEMLFLTSKHFIECNLGDFDWLTGKGRGILDLVPGTSIWAATLVKYLEVICRKPRAQGRLTNIEEHAIDLLTA